jgi:hypothetical protein
MISLGVEDHWVDAVDCTGMTCVVRIGKSMVAVDVPVGAEAMVNALAPVWAQQLCQPRGRQNSHLLPLP